MGINRHRPKGVAWFGGATWRGMRVMRISVCNRLTDEQDIDAAIAGVADAIAERSNALSLARRH